MVNRRQRHVRTGIVLKKLQAVFHVDGFIEAIQDEISGKFFLSSFDDTSSVMEKFFTKLNRLKSDRLFGTILPAKIVIGPVCLLVGQLLKNGNYRFSHL